MNSRAKEPFNIFDVAGMASFRLQIQLSVLFIRHFHNEKLLSYCTKAARLFIINKEKKLCSLEKNSERGKLPCCAYEILKTNGFELFKNKGTEEGNFTK